MEAEEGDLDNKLLDSPSPFSPMSHLTSLSEMIQSWR